MTAREFLLTDPKIEEAVSNGYDIRLEEHEWIAKMELYADTKQKLNIHGVSGKRPYYQLCPKCLGEGQVQNYGITTTAPIMRVCPTCNGAKTFLVQDVEGACANGAVDKTVSVDYPQCIHKFEETEEGDWKCINCGDRA